MTVRGGAVSGKHWAVIHDDACCSTLPWVWHPPDHALSLMTLGFHPPGSGEMEFDEFLNLTRKLVDDSGGRKWTEQHGEGFHKVYKPGSFFGERSMSRVDSKMTAVLSSQEPNNPVALMILDRATYQVRLIGPLQRQGCFKNVLQRQGRRIPLCISSAG